MFSLYHKSHDAMWMNVWDIMTWDIVKQWWCLKLLCFSKYFCFVAIVTDRKLSREPLSRDADVFKEVSQQLYTTINWYPINKIGKIIFLLIVPTPLVGGGGRRNYILKWVVFFCSVNFGRSIYSSQRNVSGIIKKTGPA